MTGWSPTAPAHPAPPPPVARPVRDTARDLRRGAVVVAVLTVVGALLGLVWAWWSPPTGAAFKRGSDGVTWLIDENEAAVSADGRFAILTLGLGVLAGGLLYTRTRLRGPITVTALAIGCLLGTQAMRLVGWLTGGGHDSGPACRIYLAQVVDGQCIEHTRLSVQAPSLYLFGAAAAVLVYGVLVSFAGRDDLGRRDPVRRMLLERRAAQFVPAPPWQPGAPPPQGPGAPPSVGQGGQP
ncbi:MAG: DUF2567 domain-containing protein [Jatrophihabitans sp.]|uniref:DUF2567 domain-containing protein n=1 Tax=Jatrophihabitans sp. TaxID=1932789 RepID=UPI003F81FF43